MVAINAGTREGHAVIARPDGHAVGAVAGDHESMRMPKHGSEQDPEDGWQATLVAVRTTLEQACLKGGDVATVRLLSAGGPHNNLCRQSISHSFFQRG
jgi:sugar (pentulose or hexulose) kinase